VFVSQSVDGVIYVARVPQWEPFLWSAIEVASDQNDRRVDVEGCRRRRVKRTPLRDRCGNRDSRG
jgi:hypothetical protein